VAKNKSKGRLAPLPFKKFPDKKLYKNLKAKPIKVVKIKN